MKKSLVLIAAIVGLCAAVAVAKETTKAPIGADIKFTGTAEGGLAGGVVNGTFSGELKFEGSDQIDWVRTKGGCRKQRKVVLYAKPERGRPARRVGADRSNNRGRYRIEASGNAIWLWVRVRKKIIIKSDGEKVVCKKGRSNKALVNRLHEPKKASGLDEAPVQTRN